MLKHLISAACPLVHICSSLRQEILRRSPCPVLIVLRTSGSSNSSLTEVFGTFSVKTLSSSVVDNGVSLPNKLHNSSLSIGFGTTFDIDTLTLSGTLRKSTFLEL